MINVVFITKITKIQTTDFFSFQLKPQDIKVHPSKTHLSHIEEFTIYPSRLYLLLCFTCTLLAYFQISGWYTPEIHTSYL